MRKAMTSSVARPNLYAVVVLALGVAWGQARGVSFAPQALTLRVSASPNTFSLFAPVVVTYYVTNPTENTIESMVSTESFSNDVRLAIQPDGSVEKPFANEVQVSYVMLEKTIHAPHQVMTQDVLVFFNGATHDLAFPKVGRYTLLGRLAVSNDEHGVVTAMAPAVDIQIVDPSVVDRNVIRLLGSEENLIKLMRFGSVGYCADMVSKAECFKDLEGIVKKYPDSGYAPALAYDLANEVGARRVDPEAGLGRFEDLLSEFMNQWREHPLVPNVMAALALETFKRGDRDAARGMVNRYGRLYPERSLQLRKLEKRIGTGEDNVGSTP